jgi:inner membrane protease subunit 1
MPPSTTRLSSLSLPRIPLAISRTIKVVALVWVAQEYAFEIKPTSGPSMYPTMATKGDTFLISKWNRRGRDVKVGDIVTLKHPQFPHERSAKRITGLPGDFVVKEAQAGESGGDVTVEGMLQIPEGHFWFVGDNLPFSRDSRQFGPVPLAMITGKIVARVWPLSRVGWMGGALRPAKQDSVE